MGLKNTRGVASFPPETQSLAEEIRDVGCTYETAVSPFLKITVANGHSMGSGLTARQFRR